MVEIVPDAVLEQSLSWGKYANACVEEALAQNLPTFALMFKQKPVDPSAGWPIQSQY